VTTPPASSHYDVSVGQLTEAYATPRAQLTARPGPPGPGRRHDLVRFTDSWLAGLFHASGATELGAALVAVGGFGREELAPGSDLDLVLLHPPGVDAAAVADRLWYPVWDSGVRLDHSVRRPDEVVAVAADDLKAAVGLLDLRLIAGDAALAGRVRESVRSDWRARAHEWVRELRDASNTRVHDHGELAHLLEPDLKEAHGGLRDVTTLRAVAATWVTDGGVAGVAPAAATLLDLRDALHLATMRPGSNRASDRLNLQDHAAVAARLGIDEDEVLRRAAAAGRAVAHALDETWHRVDGLTAARGSRRGLTSAFSRRRSGVAQNQQPQRTPLADGVVVQDGQAVLARDARPVEDPVLVLRAAAAAAQAGLRLAPATVARLAAESAPMPRPWPRAARDALVSLLGAGDAAVPVWESLDQAGVVVALLPEWEHVRSRPQRSPVHRFTVDRHLVEAAVQAAPLTRRVERPDLLLVGALLHDIGKGLPGDHSEVGERIVAELAPALGFDDDDAETLVALVRHHLLLPDTATRRDLDDRRTAESVAEAVGSAEFLTLLATLTEADARATGPAAWTPWRAGLVADLVARTAAVLSGELTRRPPRLTEEQRAFAEDAQVRVGGVDVRLVPGDGAAELTVVALDRVGLLATVAGVLSLHRVLVRAATVESIGTRAVSVWRIEPEFGTLPDAARLRADLRRALDGTLDVAGRLASREAAYPARPGVAVAAPSVAVLPGVSDSATVIEVRAHDGPALLHRIGRGLQGAAVDIRSAIVSTLGSEAVDVFYVVGTDGAPLDAVQADDLARRLSVELEQPQQE
jgi:[protein-PII] uridylyltransferase